MESINNMSFDLFKIALYRKNKKKSGSGSEEDIEMYKAALERNVKYFSGNITKIGSGAFDNCLLLESANFPSATSISGNAFLGCTKLNKIDIPLVTTIG